MTPDYSQYQKAIGDFLGAGVLAAAQADARAKFPNESCGFVANGQYVACRNASPTPETNFAINDARYYAAVRNCTLTAVIHSHPNGPLFPSAHDMQQQLATNVPWFIITLNQDVIGYTVGWGGSLPKAPLIGRPFVHGIFDCYSLVRDTFALGGDALKEQGIGWPLPPISLPEIPRDDNWWKNGQDLYLNNLAPQGFKKITRADARPGDGFLLALGTPQTNPKKKLCHAGLLLDKGLILHHLPGRDSRREPAGVWALGADLWVRYAK